MIKRAKYIKREIKREGEREREKKQKNETVKGLPKK